MRDRLLDQIHAHFGSEVIRDSAGLTRMENLMILAGRSPLDARGFVRALVAELFSYGKEKALSEFFRDGLLNVNGGTVDLVAQVTRKCIENGFSQFALAAAHGVGGQTQQEVETIIQREDLRFMERLRKAAQAQQLAQQAQQQAHRGYHGPIIVGPGMSGPVPQGPGTAGPLSRHMPGKTKP